MLSQIVKVIDPKNLESELKRAEPGALIDIEVTSAFGPQIDFFSKEFEEKEFFGALEKAIQQGFFFQLILEINAVNAVYISDFLNSIKTINPGKQHSIKIYFSLNRQDHALSLQALTPDLKSSLDTLLLFLKENSAYFSADNRQQVQDAVLFANQKRSQDEIIRLQKAFYEYTLEHQTNNGKLFSESFVKLADFWEHCSQFDPFITQKTNEATRIKLNKVSKSFCLAKWTTVSLHLESGTTHSCHHPGVHNIPLEEIAGNPSALHNTGYKIEQRKKMISGERPTECEYCWNIEDISPDTVSDRIIKSSAKYSLNQLDQIVSAPDSKRFNPRYVEVSFSNACQFKCSYCSANYSSSWAEELDKFGPYSTYSGQGHNKTFVEEENPYVRSFWDWWPDLKKDLHTFRITGGEPLLSSSTFKVLENLIEHPEPKLNLSINSN
ncbi:MAG: twitch domain-containing radical SAM protein, partial [Pseudobdellovibrio sp.]